MRRKYEYLSNCGGQILVESLTSQHNDSVLLVFADRWTLVSAEGDEEWAYVEEHYSFDPLRLPAIGYDVDELTKLQILDEVLIGKINERKAVDQAKKDEEDRQKYEQLKAKFEGSK